MCMYFNEFLDWSSRKFQLWDVKYTSRDLTKEGFMCLWNMGSSLHAEIRCTYCLVSELRIQNVVLTFYKVIQLFKKTLGTRDHNFILDAHFKIGRACLKQKEVNVLLFVCLIIMSIFIFTSKIPRKRSSLPLSGIWKLY